MPTISCIRQEASQWLNNGANLITLSRLPMLFCVQWALLGIVGLVPARLEPWLMTIAIISVWWLVVVWSYWKYMSTATAIITIIWVHLRMPIGGAEELFALLVFMQTLGMVTDGLDGRYARKYSKVGATPEGQFLDQFIDKLFVWVTWFTLLMVLARMLGASLEGALFLLGGLASLYLALLDFRSCKKHWGNYRVDRGKPVNKESGAKWQGKWKFGMENVVICVGLISFCPEVMEYQLWHQYLLFPFVWLAKFCAWLTLPALVVALLLARSSLRTRGELVSPTDQLEEAIIARMLQLGRFARRVFSASRH